MKKAIDKFIGYSAAFILFYYEAYIQIDWNVITKLGRIYYAPFAFIRAIIMWIISPIALPEFFLKRSKAYQDFKIMQKKFKKDMLNG